MGTGFSPLDKELGLGPVGLLPHVQEALVRLGACLPFAQVAEHLWALFGVQISASTVRRETERVGRGCLAVQHEQAQPLASCPEEEVGECMVMSGDGAFVPLVGGTWAEVKLLAIGEVKSRQCRKTGESQAFTQRLSYFARLADASAFSDEASSEVRRRGLDRGKQVVAVQDGAEWLQGLVQAHRADAVRILDFGHAAGRVAAIGEQACLAGQALPEKWLETQVHQLKHEGASRVLPELSERCRQAGETEEIAEHVRYLRKRQAQMDSPSYQAQGYPIGSGIVESGNKVVMQARLKGAGMHWNPGNVNPMLALRMNLCNERWREGWQDQECWQQTSREAARRDRQQQRKARKQAHAAELRALQAPPAAPVSQKELRPKLPTGRTEAQRQWGRRTFSPRVLTQGGYAKK